MLVLFWAATFAYLVAQSTDKFIQIAVNGHVCYIVPEAQGESAMLYASASMVTPNKRDGYWTPDADSIEKADTANRKLIEMGRSNLNFAFPDIAIHSERYARNAKANALNELGLVYKSLKKYRGQFVGFVVDGKKRIFCNYFNNDAIAIFHIDPSAKFVVVSDGGFNFWQVEYDVETEKCRNLAINGPWELDY
jgi:hypothetical protein